MIMATKSKATKKKSAKRAARPAKEAAPAGHNGYRVSKVFKSSKKVPVADIAPHFSRADLEFIGVDHSGASYEARVFINNPRANAATEPSGTNGYAGSFYIFGHGGCFGDVGHCDINKPPDPFDPRPSHPLKPLRKVVIATDAVKLAMEQKQDISLTIVPIVMSWTDKCELDDVLKFDHFNLVTYG
jgi:tyrosinase